MRRPRMRPTFDLALAIPGETLFERVRLRLAEGDGSISGVVGRLQAELTTGKAKRHFWSPMLLVEVYDREDGVRVLHGRFAPHHSVWTGFMAAYGVLLIAGIASAVYGASQMMLGAAPWGFVGIPVAAFWAGGIWGLAFVGQGLGLEEMYVLRTFLDRCIDDEPPARQSERPPPMRSKETHKTRSGGERFD